MRPLQENDVFHAIAHPGRRAILVLLMFSKSAYSASLSSYYTFYLIGTFAVSVQVSQLLLFLFLVAQAVGSLIAPTTSRSGFVSPAARTCSIML